MTGFHNRTPLIEFLSKGAHFANITGEKLSEYHVTQSMATVLRELDLTLTPTAWRRAGTTRQPYYGLFVERADLAERRAGVAAGGAAGQAAARGSTSSTAASATASAWARCGWSCCPAGLGAVGPRSAWQRTGGALEQYKHPCLISDMNFRAETLPVQDEAAVSRMNRVRTVRRPPPSTRRYCPAWTPTFRARPPVA